MRRVLKENGLSLALFSVGMWGYLTTSRFWFESLRNWQSEVLAVAAIVVLTIFLRERDSPESKPVAARHAMTGNG